MSYQYQLDTLANHERAARAVLAKVHDDALPGWAETLPYTFAELGHGFVYIFDLTRRVKRPTG